MVGRADKFYTHDEVERGQTAVKGCRADFTSDVKGSI